MARATTVEDVTVIATESLSKRFPRVTALDRLSVDIGPGVTGLVGANGAGKSTLIKILLGLSPATEGRAAVLGLDVATEGGAIRERVGYMPEHDCLPPDVSATEFVVHMARMSGLPPTAARERTADTLRHVGLYEERYRPIGGYSTGMKQRVKLAQALVHDPQLVFLDEPTNGLDPVGRDEMLGLIRRVHTDFGISVLVTSHLLGELERTCDHVVVIDGGKLLRSSSTTDFTQTTDDPRGRGHRHRRPPGRHRARCVRRSRPARASPARPAERPARRRPHPAARGDRARRRTTWCATPSPTSASAWSGWNSAATTSPRSSATGATQAAAPAGRRRARGRRRSAMAAEHRRPRTGAGAPTTRIHNIGYRNYDGPRLGRAYARRSLYSQSLRGAYGLGRSAKSKVLPMLLFVVMCVPAAIMVAVAVATKANDLPVDYTRYAIFIQAVIGLYLASQAPQSVSRDLRFKTVPLYFSRPIERVDYVRAEVRGAWPRPCSSSPRHRCSSSTSGALLAKLDFADQTKGFAQGLVSVALLSLLFAGIGLVIAAVTPRRGFGVAAVIAVLTISYGAVSTLQAIAYAQGNELGAIAWLGLFSPITLIDGVQSAFLGAHLRLPRRRGPRPPARASVYLLVVLGLIAGCYGLLMRRYRKVGL